MAAVSSPPIAASSGSFLITPSVGLMIWTLLLFGLSMFVLWKLAFPRISEALDKRQHAIEDSIDHAEKIRRDADELLVEYRERLKEAREQADEIVSRARRAGATTARIAVWNDPIFTVPLTPSPSAAIATRRCSW